MKARIIAGIAGAILLAAGLYYLFAGQAGPG